MKIAEILNSFAAKNSMSAEQANTINTINTALPNVDTDSSVLITVLNFVYAAGGTVAVILIVLAGYSYVTSNGDPNKASKATRTIIFAVVGLVIVVSAALITNFVMGTASNAM